MANAATTVAEKLVEVIADLTAFDGVPVQRGTDFTEIGRGTKGEKCYVQTTCERLQPNYNFYRVAATITIETSNQATDDEDGSRMNELLEAVDDWLHGVAGRNASTLGFDGILQMPSPEPVADGNRTQEQRIIHVLLTWQPPAQPEE